MGLLPLLLLLLLPLMTLRPLMAQNALVVGRTRARTCQVSRGRTGAARLGLLWRGCIRRRPKVREAFGKMLQERMIR